MRGTVSKVKDPDSGECVCNEGGEAESTVGGLTGGTLLIDDGSAETTLSTDGKWRFSQ